MKKILVLTLSVLLIFTASCGKKRPDLASKRDDKTTKQDIENFNTKNSIKELKKNLETMLKLLFFKKPDFLNFLIINYCIATTSFTSGK